MIRIIDAKDARALRRFIEPSPRDDRDLEHRVQTIVDAVRTGGDQALRRLTKRFDRWAGPVEIGPDERRELARRVSPDIRRALELAAAHLRQVCRRQRPKNFSLEVRPGVRVDQRVTPLERVGCYVPGGRFPLPSSLLMTAIPARVAGVPEVIAACPRPEPVVMAAAALAGVDRFFRIGGAHAVAALAYGTQTVPRVDKIVGPGNRYVAAAKALVSRDCSIDMHAGPTEIVVLADTRPEWAAADLVAQAEHDPDARAILVTTSRSFATMVAREMDRIASDGTVAESLQRQGAAIVARDWRQAVGIVNRMAPEHVRCPNAAVARMITHAGTVFIGEFSAPAAGDYATGSNHVLPTAGAARFRGGLSAGDFVRVTTVQRLTRRGLGSIAPAIVALARAEGLEAHARSIQVRL